MALLPSAAVDALLAGLDRGRFPEIARYPNCAIVNTHDPAATALGSASGLADKYYVLKAQLSAARTDQRPWTEYRQLQASLLGSRWFALGRLLGRVQPIVRAGGKTAPEKVAVLRQRISSSGWLRFGKRLGVASAARLLMLGTPLPEKPGARLV